MFEAFGTEILALREACSVHTDLSRAEGCAQAPLLMGQGYRNPHFWSMFKERNHCLKTNVGHCQASPE